jgi:uncharacterized protein YceH (UPF0502 family)
MGEDADEPEAEESFVGQQAEPGGLEQRVAQLEREVAELRARLDQT